MCSKNTDKEVPGEDLFRHMDHVIRTEKLYADSNLQRHDILVRFGLSRRTLCALMSAYAGGQSITAYVNSLRMEDAERLVREHPEMSFTGPVQAPLRHDPDRIPPEKLNPQIKKLNYYSQKMRINFVFYSQISIFVAN